MIFFDIITIFPEIFNSYFNEGILARAQKNKLIEIGVHNLRDWTTDKHHMVDDKPYGGGVGMVLKIEPIFKAIEAVKKAPFDKLRVTKRKIKGLKERIILFSAKGKKFTQNEARRLAKYDRLIMICGRYEGVDERVAKHIADEEISIGEYVLTGGELPAMIVVDAVSRLIPGVVGKEESIQEESFKKIPLAPFFKGGTKKYKKENQKISPFEKIKDGFPADAGSSRWIERGISETYLEHPHYTRPEIFSPDKGKTKWRVPKVLLSGNHKEIEEWKEKYSKFVNN